jgi:hypothetical protein
MTTGSVVRGRASYLVTVPRLILAWFVASVVAISTPCLAQGSRRPAPCPPPGDTVSLLQRSDSAFAEARDVAEFLNRSGLTVRCVTRSDWSGLAGIGNVAAFQTARGTITVFFVPEREGFRLTETRTPRGYRITYAKRGAHPARTVIDADNAQYVIQRERWYFHVLDASLAGDLRQAVAGAL